MTDPSSGEYGPPAATDLGPVIRGDTQVQNVEAFIAAHKGEIGLITVSIGGNDVTACVSASDPITCVGGVVGPIQTNVTTLADDLSAAAGPGFRSSGSPTPTWS